MDSRDFVVESHPAIEDVRFFSGFTKLGSL